MFEIKGYVVKTNEIFKRNIFQVKYKLSIVIL